MRRRAKPLMSPAKRRAAKMASMKRQRTRLGNRIARSKKAEETRASSKQFMDKNAFNRLTVNTIWERRWNELSAAAAKNPKIGVEAKRLLTELNTLREQRRALESNPTESRSRPGQARNQVISNQLADVIQKMAELVEFRLP
ncbi:MAG: hypothetical protein JW772_05580 [Candidatus Diapherotrites archaeon]|nr:hypothetical protein [Candidatus Diapherotrites archaeon]